MLFCEIPSHESWQGMLFFITTTQRSSMSAQRYKYGARRVCRRVERPYQNNGYLSLNWFCVYILVKFCIPIYLCTYRYSLSDFHCVLVHALIYVLLHRATRGGVVPQQIPYTL